MQVNKLTAPSEIPVLQRVLEFGNYPCQTLNMGPKTQLQRLLVGPLGYLNAAGDEDPERMLVIDLAWINDLYQFAGRTQDAFTDSLQFFIVLPFEVPEARQAEICQLMATYNLLLPLGQFVLDAQSQANFCYRLKTTQERQLAGHVVLEVIDQILYFVNLTARRLEAVAAGQLSAVQARELTERDLAGLA